MVVVGRGAKPETINYRSFKPEKDGLFCERIFGPVKDWECHCGKYKRIRYRGVICDRCGVEVTLSKVRRERMGHIELAVPVAHIWFFKTLPSPMGNLLDVTLRDLEKVIYYSNYIVIEPGDQDVHVEPAARRRGVPRRCARRRRTRATPRSIADIGAPAVRELLRRLDVDKIGRRAARAGRSSRRSQHREEAACSSASRSSMRSGTRATTGDVRNKPEWMILDVVPVIPPDLRPLVPLDGGRFATSDLNDLYRRVINRNNRLQKLIVHRAPEVILRNEKRMLQEAVDALFDNGRRSKAIRGRGKRPLKSLSDMLKGKQGRFRQNLLGKRVDYSGRSVIVVGPELKLHQCGLPKAMALELFKPFIIHKLVEKGIAETVKRAKKIVEKESSEVFEILEEIIRDHPVLLNRAPTLHRLGIQAFEPVLVEGKAIRIHPLVCAAFNADFDGDQMAVHVPLSYRSAARVPRADALVEQHPQAVRRTSGGGAQPGHRARLLFRDEGRHGFRRHREGSEEGRRTAFVHVGAEVEMALALGRVNTHTPLRFLVQRDGGQGVGSDDGRPRAVQRDRSRGAGVPEPRHEEEGALRAGVRVVPHGRGSRARCSSSTVSRSSASATRRAAASRSASRICEIPADKEQLLEEATTRVERFQRRTRPATSPTASATTRSSTPGRTRTTTSPTRWSRRMRESQDGFNPVFMMFDSGSRGSRDQIRQLAGMRGLMAKPQKKLTGGIGEIIESPIKSNFREGLSVLEYFISTHGARKGLADTALKTADAGYLTRRLVRRRAGRDDHRGGLRHDHGSRGLRAEGRRRHHRAVVGAHRRKRGGGGCRRSAADSTTRGAATLLVEVGFDDRRGRRQGDRRVAGSRSIKIRSVLTCEAKRGLCRMCYGRNLATMAMVDIGEAVGIIAAQSIGEPGTQLTLRTFHIGGTAARIAEQTARKSKVAGRDRVRRPPDQWSRTPKASRS